MRPAHFVTDNAKKRPTEYGRRTDTVSSKLVTRYATSMEAATVTRRSKRSQRLFVAMVTDREIYVSLLNVRVATSDSRSHRPIGFY